MFSQNKPSSNTRVLCRLRPVDNDKKQEKLSNLEIQDKELILTPHSDAKNVFKFRFDYIFPPDTTQEQVYFTAAKPIVDDFINGFNGTFIAYGQTSSGKTYTITGTDILDLTGMGMVPRTITTVFDYIESCDDNLEFSLKVSYFELYLEKLYDLIDAEKKNLKIRESREKGFYIHNLTESSVVSDIEVLDLLRIGIENHHIRTTEMNVRSSRSHTIFSIEMNINSSVNFSGHYGKLWFVDLAGSERLSKSGNEGLKLKELRNINKSLNALSSVISSLIDNSSKHIPYRDSKLTKILANSFGGNSNTVIILNCSPLANNETETLATLRFGSIANAVVNRPKINREFTLTELKLKLFKTEEKLKKKTLWLNELEKLALKNNIKISEADVEELTNDLDVLEFLNENDEFLTEVENVSINLTNFTKENSGLKKQTKKITLELEEYQSKITKDEAEIKFYEDKYKAIESSVITKTSQCKKLEIEKNAMEETIEELQTRKIELDKILDEKELEYKDLEFKVKVQTGERENPDDPDESIEELKKKLMQEQVKYKKNQRELCELQIRYNAALKNQLMDKNFDYSSL